MAEQDTRDAELLHAEVLHRLRERSLRLQLSQLREAVGRAQGILEGVDSTLMTIQEEWDK